MNGWALLGILCIAYAIAVFYIAIKQPHNVWSIKKIKGFIKVLGEKGTVIFFLIWGAIFAGLGVWLLMK